MIQEARCSGLWPIHLQPKNPTMDKKLVVTVCPNGTIITRDQNPKQPYTPKQVAEQAVAAFKEGAVEAHFHARDAEGYSLSDAEPYIETIELISKECPDMIMCPSISITPKKAGGGLYEVETTQTMIEDLVKRGKQFIETTIITPVSYISPRPIKPGEQQAPGSTVTREKMVAETEFLQSKGIKPDYMCHNIEGIENVKEWIIEPGIYQKPHLLCLGHGMHKPSIQTYPDPWGMIYLMTMIQYLPKDCVWGASIGGRNWLPMTVLAIMLGVSYIRVGMEDASWLYPHKNDLIESNAQVTRKVVTIARELGREIATPAEARAILGIK